MRRPRVFFALFVGFEMIGEDESMIADYLRRRNPALIVLAYGSNESNDPNWTEESYRETLNWPSLVAFVSEDDGGIAGFLIGRRVTDEAEILNLAVVPTGRRRGKGSALLEAALEEFRTHGVSRVFLEVRESNETGMGFYEKHGFFKTGRRAGYYREPDEAAIVMEMKLAG